MATGILSIYFVLSILLIHVYNVCTYIICIVLYYTNTTIYVSMAQLSNQYSRIRDGEAAVTRRMTFWRHTRGSEAIE